MKNLYNEMPNGYRERIQKGLGAGRYFSRKWQETADFTLRMDML